LGSFAAFLIDLIDSEDYLFIFEESLIAFDSLDLQIFDSFGFEVD